MNKDERKFEYYTLTRDNDYGWISLHGWSTYPENSVLAGQAQKVWLKHYDTKEEAEAANPGVKWSSHWMEPQISLNHLPDDGDY